MTPKALDALAAGLAPVVVDEVAAALAPLLARLAVLETRAALLEKVTPASGAPGAPGTPGRDGTPGKDGRDGVDGFDLKDFTIEYDGARTLTLGFTSTDPGRLTKAVTITIPALLYQGVYEDGRAYVKGDVVTWGGHAWIALAATTGKPGVTSSASRDWQLAVKAGRDGREGKPGPVGAPGPRGEKGDAVRYAS